MTPEQLAEQLMTWLRDGTTVIYAVPLVVLLTNILKLVPFLKGIQAAHLHIVVQVGFWAVYAAVNHYGGGQQLEDVVGVLTPFLQVLLPLVVSLFGGHALYNAAKMRDLPGFGYQRPAAEDLRVRGGKV